MSDRVLELILKVNDQASQQIKAIRQELEKIQAVQGVSGTAGQGFEGLGRQVEGAKNKLGGFGEAASTAFKAVGALAGGEIIAGVGLVATAFNQTTESVEKLIAASREAYGFLIESNEVYQKQLLSAQAAIANSSRITVNGKEITDTVEKIQSLRETVTKTFQLVEKETENIADLTNAQVNEIFTSVISNYSKLQSQLKTDKLKEFDASLNSNEATLARLSARFAAFSKTNLIDSNTLNVGIRNILSGTNVNESLLAQRIGITQQDVQQYQARGTLILELLKRLEGAGKASSLASTAPGSSLVNISDTFQRIGRQAGEPLYNAFGQVALKALQSLQAIEPQLTAFFKGITQGIVDIIGLLSPVGDEIGKVFGTAGQYFSGLSKDFDEIKTAAAPITEAFSQLGQTISAIDGPLDQLKGVFEPLKQIALDTFIPINQGLETIQLLTQAFTVLKDSIVGAFNAVGSQVSGVVNGINAQIRSLIQNPAFQVVAKALGVNVDEATKSLANMDAAQRKAAESAKGLGKAQQEIKPIEAPNLGTINEQIDAALKNARDRFKNTSRDTFQQDFKTGLDAYKTAVETGRLSTQDALKDLEELQTRQELNPQQAAQVAQEITRIRQEELKRQVGDVKASQAEIGATIAKGGVDEIEGAKELGEAKKKELDAQLENTRASILAEENAINKGGGNKNRLQELRAQERQLSAQSVTEEVKGREQVAAARNKEAERAKKDLEIQAEQTRTNVEKGVLTETEGAKQVSNVKRKELQEQLNAVKQNLAEAQAAGDAVRVKDLTIEQKRLQADLDAQAIEGRKQVAQARVQEAELAKKGLEVQAEREEIKAKKGLETEEQAARKITDIKKQELDKQLAAVQANLDEATKAGDKKRAKELTIDRDRLLAQRDEQEIKGREDVQKAREKETNLVKKQLDAQIELTQASVEAGTVKEVEGAKRVTALKKQELDKQLADIQKAIAEETKASGGRETPRLKELKADQNTLLANRQKAEVDGERQVREAVLAEFQRAQNKATSIAKLAETERLQEVQKLINVGVLRREDADLARLDAQRKNLETEVQLAQQTQARLEALPKSNNPRQEEERQQQIREARQKTADYTLQLLENEKAQQEAVLAKIKRQQDEQALAIKNQLEQQKLLYNAQAQAIDSANKLLERRSQLLEAQKNLIKSASDLQQAGYKNAIDLLQSQFDTEDKILDRQKQREELQKKAAEGDTGAAEELAALDRREARERQIINLKIEAKQAELVALDKQQELERASEAIEERKTLLLQKQEEIRLRIALADAKSQAAQAVADAAKTAADPNATAAQKEQAQIAVQAANQKVGFAQEAIQLQKTISATTEEEFAERRQTLANQQAEQRTTKQTELQTLQNQGFSLSPLQQGTPEDIANQRAVAAEDARNRAAVQAEEARSRGYSTPLQQAQQARAFEDAQGPYLQGGGLGAAGSNQLQAGVLNQARSPIEALASQQTAILGQSAAIQEKANGFLQEILKTLNQGASTPNGMNNTINISGQLDPNKAAAIAMNKIEKSLGQAFNRASR